MASEREEGLAALQRGDFQTAAVHLETATQQDSNDFQTHLYLGGVYHHLERYAEAARVLTQATALQPTSAQARYNLGVAQEQNNDFASARSSFREALRLQPDYPIAHEALGRVLTRLEEQPASSESKQGSKANLPDSPGYESAAPVYRPSANSSFGRMSETIASPSPNPNGVTSSETNLPPSAPSYPTPAAVPPYSTQENSQDPSSQPSGGRAPGLADYGQPLPGSLPPSSNPMNQGSAPAYGAANYSPRVDMAGNPIDPVPPFYSTPPFHSTPLPSTPLHSTPPYGMPGQYAPPAQVPYGMPGQHGQPGYAPPRQTPYNGPPNAPYGQPQQPYPPTGPGYAPPGSYGYGGAPQYVVPQQLCQEAQTAMVLSIVGIFANFCMLFGIILHPISLIMALRAKKMMRENPNLTGQTEATIALIISSIFTSLYAIVFICILLSLMFTN